MAVTVPWSKPVGTALIAAFSRRCKVSPGGMGTAMSMSFTAQPDSALRTAPPTKRPSPRAAMSLRVSGAVIQACLDGSRRITTPEFFFIVAGYGLSHQHNLGENSAAAISRDGGRRHPWVLGGTELH